MRLRLPLSLRSALLACSVLFTTVASASVSDGNLGNVMYIGDSITHGVNSGSWRWAMHKIFTDNGVSYTEKGIMTGNFSGGVAAGTSYGGKIFQNIHSSAASARTYEIAGRANGSNYGRFDGSNIKNWLGLSTEKTKGGSYAGQTFTGANKPDTFFLLSGTNDLLSDGDNNSLFYRLDGVTSLLLGDMDSIVSSIRTANSQASILVMTIPCWTQHSNGNLAETHQAVASYNESLKEWGTNNAANGVKVIDINAGIIDAASSTPFYGVRSMFNNPTADGLHPNAQGDLLMAGNLAKGMGYAGRSAGQERKATHELEVNFGQNPSITQQTLEANGFTRQQIAETVVLADELFIQCCNQAESDARFLAQCAVTEESGTVLLQVKGPMGGRNPLENTWGEVAARAAAYILKNTQRVTFESIDSTDIVTVTRQLEAGTSDRCGLKQQFRR